MAKNHPNILHLYMLISQLISSKILIRTKSWFLRAALDFIENGILEGHDGAVVDVSWSLIFRLASI